jgi:two-component system, chemotaxis family, chemotaxis protein CheY
MSKVSPRAVVVDDDRLIRELLTGILRNEGFQVVGEADDGQRGLAVCQKEQPEIVFLDINMPKMNGIQALIEIKKRCPATHVVMVSGESDVDTVRQAVTHGADGYIIKPFRPFKVAEAVSRYLK